MKKGRDYYFISYDPFIDIRNSHPRSLRVCAWGIVRRYRRSSQQQRLCRFKFLKVLKRIWT